jgi:uncharacterized protein YihD (DUF1040 family)
MRDIERIDVLLKLLKDYWKQNQDLRLGQILSIVAKDKDVFYIEDDNFIEWLEENIYK